MYYYKNIKIDFNIDDASQTHDIYELFKISSNIEFDIGMFIYMRKDSSKSNHIVGITIDKKVFAIDRKYVPRYRICG
jgi:hypothetical protein